MDQIRNLERSEGCKNTIILGDFNMNPFDHGMIAGNAFNAVMSESIARKGYRTIQGKKHEYFYNPSWKLYGSDSKKPGTYFLSHPNHTSFHWNIYDQVLIRPSLLEHYEISYSAIQDDKFFNNMGTGYSDHSPIKFELIRRE